MPSQKNIKNLKNISDKLSKAKSIFFTDYLGLNVSDVTILRRDFFNNDVEYKVVKNTLLKIALDENDLDFGDDFTYIGNSSLLNALEFRATLGGSKITIEAKNLTLDEGLETDEFKFTLTYKF